MVYVIRGSMSDPAQRADAGMVDAGRRALDDTEPSFGLVIASVVGRCSGDNCIPATHWRHLAQRTSDEGRRRFSPARLQLLVTTIGSLVAYAEVALAEKALPTLPDELLFLVAASNTFYLGGKVVGR
jgi:hypothetical protein